MPAEPEALLARFDELNRSGKSATLRGEFSLALAAYAEAHEVAVQLANVDRIDRAQLNVAMVRIQMGETRRGEEGLREILLRSSDSRVAFTAAYHLASSQRKRGQHQRAMAYARRALDRARALGSPDMLAACHNLIGNIFLSQNYLDEALAAYHTALELRRVQPEDVRHSIAILEDNIGYCQLLKKQYGEGTERILAALQLAEEVSDRRCRAECLQDLCYGHLLRGEHEKAAVWGERALGAALEAGYGDIAENCHYLLGAVADQLGDLEQRDRHFARLQELHPELPFLKDFLCSVDVTHIITLRR
jgi:tetratricopeptide (TPR) repeat protein